MRIRLNINAAELPGEAVLLARLERASKKIGGPIYSEIAVKNAEDTLRLAATTFTESEENALTILLADAGFNDELVTDYEQVDEHGSVDCSFEVASDPDYACVYSLRPAKMIKTRSLPLQDPGPDPSWGEFYMPRSR